VRGEFADYGAFASTATSSPSEVKRVKSKLAARQLRQVEMYAVNEGIEWAILTNGSHWQVYHLGDRVPIQIDLALDVDLSDEDRTLGHKADELFYLSRESMKRRQIDELWQARRATGPKSLVSGPSV
jgi:predicted type IV restriction endonuclease